MLQTSLSFQVVPIMSQDHTLHSVVMILLLLLIWNSFWVFFFLDTDIPEECRPIILYNNHQLWFVWCFFKIIFHFCTFGRDTTKVLLCSFPCIIIRKLMLSIRLTADNIIFYYVVKVVSAMFFYCKIILPFKINEHIPYVRYFKTILSILLLLKLSPISFSIHW